MPTTLAVNVPTPDQAELYIDSLLLPMTAQDLEGLIDLLKNVRAALQPPVSRTPVPPGTPILVTAGPPMRVDRDVMLGGVSLQIRHPGLGWLPFRIPPTDVAARRTSNTLLHARRKPIDVQLTSMLFDLEWNWSFPVVRHRRLAVVAAC